MPHGHSQWPTKPLSSCIKKVVVPYKVPKKDFLESGKLPVVSQEAGLINGYWDNDQHAIGVDEPIVVFGDHTQVLKLIDFDFVVGADGVRILKPKEFLNASFLRYFLEANPIPSLGYARHYRHISGLPVPVPTLEEQHRIVAILDKAFAALDRARAHAEENLADTLALSDTLLNEIITEAWSHPDTTTTSFERVVFLQEGPGIRKYEYAQANEPGYPMINVRCVQDDYIDMSDSRSAKMDLAVGKWSHFRVEADDILFTISGTIGRSAIARESDLPILMNTSVVRFRPKDGELSRNYLYRYVRSRSFLKALRDMATGAAQKNVGPTHIRTMDIKFPPLAEQEKVVQRIQQTEEKMASLAEKYGDQISDIVALRQSLLQQAFSGQLT